MQARQILIGSGFCATPLTEVGAVKFLMSRWLPNTRKLCGNIVIVDNAANPLPPISCVRVIRCNRNLGHMSAPLFRGQRLLGWSMSWILPALVAYADGCDFIYKEQDCLAFGDWISPIRRGAICVGRNSIMPCEQSLFHIAHDAILDCVQRYMAEPAPDDEMSSEDKMHSLGVEFFDMPCGRDRPIQFELPFYAQRLTPAELQALTVRGLL